jgi:hypothetical protein
LSHTSSFQSLFSKYIQHVKIPSTASALGRPSFSPCVPTTASSSSSPGCCSVASLCHPSPCGTSHFFPFPSYNLKHFVLIFYLLFVSCLQEFLHLKVAQRKLGRMGAAVPTGIAQQVYSLGTGSSRTVTLLPTWGTPQRLQDGGAGGTGKQEIG